MHFAQLQPLHSAAAFPKIPAACLTAMDTKSSLSNVLGNSKSTTAHLIRQAKPLQANQQVQQAWAQVKSKEPLNKRASMLASSGSNVQDHMQRQPTSRAPEQRQQRPQSASRPNVQSSRSDNSNQQVAASQAAQPSSSNGVNSSEQMGYGQMSGSFGGGQTGAGQLTAPLSSNGLLQNGGMQMPYPGQGETSLTQIMVVLFLKMLSEDLQLWTCTHLVQAMSDPSWVQIN